MNTRNITPFSLELNTGIKTATIFSIRNIFDYHFDNGSAKVIYVLSGMESRGTYVNENGDMQSYPESAIDYAVSQMDIPASVIQTWGTDDNVIFDYVANQLGITIINNN